MLCWNVRGLNSEIRQREVRGKIEESECSVICLEETKCESFDWKFLRKFRPKRFDRFAFSPSIGASGGILVLWISSIFDGQLIDIQRHAVTVNFTSKHDNSSWKLVSVYGPCQGVEQDLCCVLDV